MTAPVPPGSGGAGGVRLDAEGQRLAVAPEVRRQCWHAFGVTGGDYLGLFVPLYGAAVLRPIKLDPSLDKSPARRDGQAMARRLRLDPGRVAVWALRGARMLLAGLATVCLRATFRQYLCEGSAVCCDN